MSHADAQVERRLRGIPISAGTALGRASPLSQGVQALSGILPGKPQDERSRLLAAVSRVSAELDGVAQDVSTRIGAAEAMIFKAQRTILNDPAVLRDIVGMVEDHQTAAEAAVAEVFDRYERQIGELDDEYIRDRGSDIGEVRDRLLEALQPPSAVDGNARRTSVTDLVGQVLVAEDLPPSIIVEIDPKVTLALVTERGGKTSHAAILARALGIPAVAGIREVLKQVPLGAEILVDGDKGQVTLYPSEDTLGSHHHELQRGSIRFAEAVDPVAGLRILANINLSTDVADVRAMKAEGIGLYRTEFELLAAGRILDEDEQYQRYASVVNAMDGAPVCFRLLDIGGDKGAGFLNLPTEENPYLGFRGSRLLLARDDLMRPQARAIARASLHGPVCVLYPMVTELEQFERLKWLFCEEIANTPKGEIRHGVMLEVPAACLQGSRSPGRSGPRQHRDQRPDPVPLCRRPQQRSRRLRLLSGQARILVARRAHGPGCSRDRQAAFGLWRSGQPALFPSEVSGPGHRHHQRQPTTHPGAAPRRVADHMIPS